MDFSILYNHSCMLFLGFLFIFLGKANSENCDFFKGSWVLDSSYPLYDSKACPFVDREYGCPKNGRPDQMYQKYRWQPTGCKLKGFDGRNFLEKLRGKSIMFIGDSLSRNQWMSLVCMIHNAVPQAKYILSREGDVSTLKFTEYGVKVMLHKNFYLVDLVNGTNGKILKLDSVEIGDKIWKGIDKLVFNTWQWWYRRKPGQPWDYIQVGNQILKDMDRMAAFERALNTWVKWVDTNIDPAKTQVFFQGISPSHYNGTEWKEPGVKSCINQKLPVAGSTYFGAIPPALTVLKRVLTTVKKPVTLLDITTLSQLRKDGHPSIYGFRGKTGMDCTHWCLAGVPDAWNIILYNLIM